MAINGDKERAGRGVSDRKLREIGARLIWLRETMGQTQAQFALYLQIGVDSLNKWEKGVRQPNLDTLCTISAQTGATLDFILGGKIGPAMNDELLAVWLNQHMIAPAFVSAVQHVVAQFRAGFSLTLEAGLTQVEEPSRRRPRKAATATSSHGTTSAPPKRKSRIKRCRKAPLTTI